jgi:hypothetical protein
MTFNARLHRYIRIPEAMDWLRLGWMPLPSLAGTSHGRWSVHCVWICGCSAPALSRFPS